MRKLRTALGVTGVIKSLESGEFFDDFTSKTAKHLQNAYEIDSADDNLSVESDSQANQRNQT